MKNTHRVKEKLLTIPELPGIYQMLDAKGKIIYVGKSKCLNKRVKSYFTASPKWEKVNRMVTQIHDIEYLVTDTHLEARLLECELIKKFKPKYNAQMNHDNGYVFIKVEDYNHYNPLRVVELREENSFGPLRGRYSLQELIASIKNLYPITKSDTGYQFDYHMFPIDMDQVTFENQKTILLELFTQEEKLLILNEFLYKKMEEAALQYRYEMAGIYRDMMKGFERLHKGIHGYKSLIVQDILLQIPITEGYKLFYVSDGQIQHSDTFQEVSKQSIKDFLEQGKEIKKIIKPEARSEKSEIDFRDILYSEVLSLPEEMVFYLT